MSEDYRMEIDALKKEISELKELFHQLVDQKTESRKQQDGEKESITQQEEGLKIKLKLLRTCILICLCQARWKRSAKKQMSVKLQV